MRLALHRRSRNLWFSLALVLAGCDAGRTAAQHDWAAERRRMVDEQLRPRGIRSPRVLDAMLAVPRHLFVPTEQRDDAYSDSPLPIGHDQTISQPYIVALMTETLEVEPDDRVMEIGTGSGYQAAVLSMLVKEVYTIEIVPPLAARARDTLARLGYRNVEVRTGNGYLGWPEHAPYDRIVVTAAPDEVPPALVQQLKPGGMMAIPVGTGIQELRILRRTASGLETLAAHPVRFVPMVGKEAAPMAWTLESSAFRPNGEIPRKYTCEGDDVSPPLAWSGAPAGTKSVALIVDDPDAPDPSAPKTIWVHWVVYNLPASTHALAEGASRRLPAGARDGKNDWKRTGYGGPCPPIGRHRYVHKLYALDVELPDLHEPTKTQLESAMKGHILGLVELVGTYQKGRG